MEWRKPIAAVFLISVFPLAGQQTAIVQHDQTLPSKVQTVTVTHDSTPPSREEVVEAVRDGAPPYKAGTATLVHAASMQTSDIIANTPLDRDALIRNLQTLEDEQKTLDKEFGSISESNNRVLDAQKELLDHISTIQTIELTILAAVLGSITGLGIKLYLSLQKLEGFSHSLANRVVYFARSVEMLYRDFGLRRNFPPDEEGTTQL